MSPNRQPAIIVGSPPSAIALDLLRACAGPGPLRVVYCENNERCDDLAGDLRTLARAFDLPTPRIAVLPEWERSPYAPVAPSIRIRLRRVAALAALIGSEPPQILITTPLAARQRTLPRAVLEAHRFRISAGQPLPEGRERVIRRLVESGYTRVDTVEDPGTFAARGDLIDLFPPDARSPLRITTFGDDVEELKPFDPATQVSRKETLNGVDVFPARELFSSQDTASRLRERVKARADDVGIPRPLRDPVLERIRLGVPTDQSDFWAPFAYDKPSVLEDYLPDTAVRWWIDRDAAGKVSDAALAEMKAEADAAAGHGMILPGVDELFGALGSSPDERVYESMTLAEHSASAQPSGASLLAAAPLAGWKQRLREWLDQGWTVIALGRTPSQRERISALFEEIGITAGAIRTSEGVLSQGFQIPGEKLAIILDSELLGERAPRRKRESTPASDIPSLPLSALADLDVGDLVVHADHGIGRYQGLSRLSPSGAPTDFIQVEYAKADRLYLPVYRLNAVQKYSGPDANAALDRLGSQHFARVKDRARESARKLAIDLVRLYAERKARPGIAFPPRDAELREFEAKFPYDETPDQLQAIDAVLSDLSSGRVMDRLVCGDVGYGKTEVAMRATFRAISQGKQVAVLVPTTVLASQHEQSFRQRMKDYPFHIAGLSRFKSPKEQQRVVEGLAQGKIDVVIGTHRLLSKDIQFSDLGLLIIDEEHRFGVEHKEKLTALRTNTHVLTLTATPIPRTLHFALSGLRDISLINTPPADRLPIKTFLTSWDDALVARAAQSELDRGGQVFFVHNRVATIHRMAERLRELLPKARILVGHGQMPEQELETTMLKFQEKQADILLCTAIIESGLDIPSVNTIFIDRADMFGLAQLYQIRGRVGRGQNRAYAYLIAPDGVLSDDARKRLETIHRFVELGSGFSVASHDLEIRGGGDLLGPQQSGHIAAVGLDFYLELLEDAVREVQRAPQGETSADFSSSKAKEPEIRTPFAAYFPDEYVTDVHQRLVLYRRLSAAQSSDEVQRMEAELIDRFGKLPPEASHLLWIIRIKILLRAVGVESLTVGQNRMALVPGSQSQLDPARAVAMMATDPARYQITPESRFLVALPAVSLPHIHGALERLLSELIA